MWFDSTALRQNKENNMIKTLKKYWPWMLMGFLSSFLGLAIKNSLYFFGYPPSIPMFGVLGVFLLVLLTVLIILSKCN